ncbi:MAG: hypothetical protein KDC05_13760 [Bacteroidales bacterium]|nr:hypothetical protein [Bacteroidales bacterium]
MKLYFAYIVSLLVGVQAFAFGPMDARKMYFEGWEGSCGATMLVDTLQQNEIKDDPVMMAYKGAALTTLANCKDTPFSKLSVFNKGKDLLETAIGMDAESVEARFLRYTVQTNIPGILNYNNLEEDKHFIMERLTLPQSPVDAELKSIIATYMLEHGDLSDAEISELKNVMAKK